MLVAALCRVPRPRHFIAGTQQRLVPSAFAEICMFFHLINSVYIQLIFAY